jgi:hypothetical protein
MKALEAIRRAVDAMDDAMRQDPAAVADVLLATLSTRL